VSAASRDGRNVGRSVPRVEDPPLLRGRAQYVGDLALPGMLEAVFLRSVVPHARIVSVDPSPAAAAPGVALVVTADDLDLGPLHPPIENPDAFSPPRPLLARERVRFVGEPIAVAVAASPYLAEDAIELLDVELEPLSAVTDPFAAQDPDAPALHEGSSNVLYDHRFDSGGVDEAFASAAVVLERRFRNPRYSAAPIETRGVVATPEGDGVTVWSSTQAPHRLATIMAELLGLAPALVRVLCPDVGGGFGQKAHVYPEEILVPWLALRLQRPVRWIEDRAENLVAASHARDQHVSVRVAADAAGRLLALEADVVCDTGAYGVFPHGHLLEALGTPAMLPGPYRLDRYRFRSRSVATNKAPEGAYRGVGLPVSAFVHERVMDILAREVGLDPAEVRRRNLLRPEDLPHTTLTHQRYDSGDYPRALETALDTIGYHERGERRRRDGRLRGFGICCYVEYTAINSRVFKARGMVGIAGEDGAHVALDADGGVTLWTTLPAIGQGTETTFAQQVADELGVPLGRVTVARADTSAGALRGTGTFASRSAISGGGAISAAVAELRRRLLEDAGNRLEVAEEDLRIREGRVEVVGSPTHHVEFGELVAAGGRGRFATSRQFDPPALGYPYATHVCEVAVDADTGATELVRYVVVEDCGAVINPLIVEGQIHGATAQGIAGTMYEEHVYTEDGQLVTGSFMDYLVPTASEIPPFEVAHLAVPERGGELRPKGVGEGGTLAPPGAVANAVSDALAREFNELPLRPEAIRAAARRSPASAVRP
jgi:aerobic carbon-monoxide dehydrogenase large subunit